MDGLQRHRRDLLRAGGLALVGGLAGCVGDDGTDGSDGDDGTDGSDGGDGNGSSPVDDRTTTTEQTTDPARSGPFEKTAELRPEDEEGHLGRSIALADAGDLAVLGYPDEPVDDGSPPGAVHVYARTDGEWRRRARLVPDDADGLDGVGSAVEVSGNGDVVLVGASMDEDPNGESAGSASVFERSGDTWEQQAKLVPDDGDEMDRFGADVALSGSGDTAVVSTGYDEATGEGSGASYVYERSGGNWQQAAKLAPDDGDEHDYFGVSVALSRDGAVAVVGAYRDEDPNGESAGSAYVFERSDGDWTRQAKLDADGGDPNDWFGRSVEISDDGDLAVITARDDEDPNGQFAGSAYVYELAGGTWSRAAKFAARNGEQEQYFGGDVAASGPLDTVLVGASQTDERDGRTVALGSAHVFSRTGGGWTQQQLLQPDEGSDDDWFGSTVAMAGSGDTAMVSVPATGDAQRKSRVFVYER
jgi:hypothetical protein